MEQERTENTGRNPEEIPPQAYWGIRQETGNAVSPEPEKAASPGVEGLMYQESAEKKKKRIRMFETLVLPTLLYALIYTFLLYDNLSGITMPFFVGATAVYVFYVMKRIGIAGKKYSGWYILMMLLLGISDMLTGNTVIQTFNNIGIFLLLICLLLYQHFDVSGWGMPAFLRGIFSAVFGAIANLPEPFSDGAAYFSADNRSKKAGKGIYILIGAAAAIPFLAIVTTLLYFADAVFAEFLREGLKLNLKTLFQVILFFCFAFLSAYCGMRYLEKRCLKTEVRDYRKGEPVAAITLTLLVGAVYVVFCGIQVVYLFLGKMDLPGGYTYAAYAREGFFQLLFVCVMNLALVLFIQRFFREHALLKVLLTLICACTYVMIASSGLRMMMYIRAYQLTFLRVLVLWTLILIAVLLIGILCQIWKKKFPLFSYGLVTVCVCYLALSFGHVDYFIASYNLAGVKTEGEKDASHKNEEGLAEYANAPDYSYLERLSTDAAPAVYQALKEGKISADCGDEKNVWLYSYIYKIDWDTQDSWRQFNVSHALASRLFSDEMEKLQ